jgi:hypothetical protein
VVKLTINELKPNQVYYFTVRGEAGCQPGEWSRIIQVKTTSRANLQKHFYAHSPSKDIGNYLRVKTQGLSTTQSLKTVEPSPTVTQEVLGTSDEQPTTTQVKKTEIKPSTAPTTQTNPSSKTSWWQRVKNWFGR